MSKIILNVGVVGTGVGREHINAYRLQPEKFRVKAICSFDSEMGTKLASYDSDCYFTDNILKLLADKSIHIIDICVPPIGHFELIRRVLSSNKHVICEKPLVSSLAQFDELESDLRISKYRIFPVFQYRFGDGFRSLIRCHEIGILGSPLIASLETHWSRGTEYYSVPWRGTWQGELGGALLGHAIHIHDMATLILGEVSSVAGFADTLVNPIETEDCAAISMRMHSGALVTSSVTLGAVENNSRFRICFKNVTVDSDIRPYVVGGGIWKFSAKQPHIQKEIESVCYKIRNEKRFEGFAGFVSSVYDALMSETDFEVSLESARQSIELVTAFYSAIRSGQQESLPLSSEHPYYSGWIPR